MTQVRFLGLLLAACLAAGCGSDAAGVLVQRIELVSGDAQTGGQGVQLAAPVVVRVLTSNGTPAAGIPVEWRTIAGGGRVISADSVTGSDGVASAQWELGLGVGENLLLVTSRAATLTLRATAQRRIENVFAGGQHTCAISSLGEAFCWGANDRGQLGDGTTANRTTPTRVAGGLRFRTLSLGWSFTCGITRTQETYCWGDNSEGQLGIGSAQARAFTPTPVSGSGVFTSIGTGYIHACGVLTDGAAYCWGNNAQNQLGNGTAQSSNTPVRVAGSTLFKQVSAGEFHSCAIATDNTAYCWGWNSYGELGSGAFGSHAAAPAQVTNTARFTAISAGTRHTCAIATDNTVYCWGRSGSGENGKPQFVNTVNPDRIPGTNVFQAIGTGNVSSCGLGPDATANSKAVFCWGSVATLDLGPQPVKVLAPADAALAVGFEHACGIRDGEVWCWGSNSAGQLGVSGIAASNVPVRVGFGDQ